MILQWLPKALANRDAQIAYIAQDNPLAAITQGDLIKTPTKTNARRSVALGPLS